MLDSPMPNQAAAADRPCRICRRVRPADEFRLRTRGGTVRLSECNACHAAAERARRAARRDQEDRRAIARAAAELRRASWHRVARVVAEMEARFGGTAAFIGTWHTEVTAAMRRRPGSKVALDTFIALSNMLAHIETHRPPQPEMSLAEAHAILDRLMTKYGDNATGAA